MLCGNEFGCSDNTETLQSHLKSASKYKIYLEREVYKLRSKERTLCEELYTTTSEIGLLTEQLEDLNDKISCSAHQISKISILQAAEKSKIESCVNLLKFHEKGFQEMYAEKRNLLELRNQELKLREDEEQELERHKQNQIEKQNELKDKEASDIEQMCSAIENECCILKKRNNAIMLKLRRKLIETEDARRAFLNKKAESLVVTTDSTEVKKHK